MTEQRQAFDPPFFATAAKGTEGALRDELRELGFKSVRADRGGVHFGAGGELGPPTGLPPTGRELGEGARACLELRTALRVLHRLAVFEVPDGDALYEGIASIDWRPYLTAQHTLAVRSACKDSRLSHSQFIAQKTKDAIVDQLRSRAGARPSVDLVDPDLTLFVHVVRDRATVYLDLSGESLHKRGYRKFGGDAPLKENLAAAILRLSGWDRQRPLVDPMCGSGTIPIEAALWARRIAPGLGRERFGFERWACHDAGAQKRMSELRRAAQARILNTSPRILGCDINPEALAIAEENGRAASVRVEWKRQSITELEPLVPAGMVVTNPPYGERIAASAELYNAMAHTFTRLKGHRIAILAGTPAIVRPIRWRPSQALGVYNGDIECRLLTYEVRG
jgi:23S rRNA G2445 N2-methylase RlmL